MRLSYVDREEFRNAIVSLKGILLKADKLCLTKSDVIKGYIKINSIETIFVRSERTLFNRLCMKFKRRSANA